jgi:hypothetical protein
MRVAHSARLAAILAVGAFALHQVRYLIAPGAPSEVAGHGYISDLLAPIAVLVLAGAVATLIRGTEGASLARAPLGSRIAAFAGALLSIYIAQESLEALVMAGHLHGAAMLAGGGWIAPPLALVIGALAAVVARALEVIERAIAVVHAERMRSRAPAVRGRPLPARRRRLPSAPLAFGLARRPPPVPA